MKFFSDGFNVEILSKGTAIDDESWPGERYQCDTYTVRLNSVALGEYNKAEPLNSFMTYDRVKDYLAYESEKDQLMRNWRDKLTKAMGIPDYGTPGHGVCIQKILSEFFAVVHTFKLDESATEA